MKTMIKFLFFVLPVLSICFHSDCLAAASDNTYIPESLKPWTEWVLQDWTDRNCVPCTDEKAIICNWPGPLALDLDNQGGRFSQHWDVRKAGWIPLPGNKKYPPRKVLLNNIPAMVISKNGRFGVHIKTPGTWVIQGEFVWKTLPQSIPLAENTAIVHPLMVHQASQSVQRSGNILWLRPEFAQKTEQVNQVLTKIYRKITDSVPMMLTTRIELNVTGFAREIILDWQVPASEIPVSLESPLSVKMDKQQRIHVQASPGKHTITCISRRQGPQGPVSSIKREADSPGPDVEYWSFEARNQLRMVQISGDAASVDPGQTSIPADWQNLPAYLVKKGQSLNFITLKRGMNHDTPNDLHINRKFWLDQDGKGMTVEDSIQGRILGKPRLSIQAPAQLGRMMIDGKDQLITRILSEDAPGVEVRKGQIQATAVSRVEHTRTFPAGGWSQTMNHVSADLILPPGWTLLHAKGADAARSWISSWTLLDCFLLLVIAIACFRLIGPACGLPAIIAIGLCIHDPNAPVFIWMWLLACIALLQVLPPGRLKNVLTCARYLLIVTALFIALPYGFRELQTGFFPQLETEYSHGAGFMGQKKFTKENAFPVKDMQLYRSMEKTKAKAMITGQVLRQHMEISGKVQAGPGLPETDWKQIRLSWNGPVEPNLFLRLFLISPRINLILALIKVTAIFGLLFSMVGFPKKKGCDKPKSKTIKTAILIVGISLALPFTSLVSQVQASDFPDKDLLDTLEQRLKKPAPCFPHCADFSDMDITWNDRDIHLVILASCLAETAVPLPISDGIFWQKILVDSNVQSQPVSLKNQTLWLALNPGQHTITMTGRTDRADIQMHLPLVPHIVSFNGNNQWQIKGINANGVPESQLQFLRVHGHGNSQKTKPFETSVLPPLIRIHRTLHLGLQWTVTTRIQRMSPEGSAIFLSVPLIQGESLLDGRYQVKENAVQVSLGAHEQSRTWTCVLEKQNSLVLKAPDTTTWYEVWEMDASPVWHTQIQGLSPIHGFSENGEFRPVWHPWPGEQTRIMITRPAGIEGSTRVIESARLFIEPGMTSTKFSLNLSIRSTMGGQHTILLPEKAKPLSMILNGQTQPLGKDHKVIFPLSPGSSHLEISWTASQGISTKYAVPKIDLGVSGVNAHVEIQTANRWIWFVKGPLQGPAILFFGEVLMIIGAGIVLGRLQFSPMNTFQWIILGLGISQSDLIPGVIIVVWFSLLWIRKQKIRDVNPVFFNLVQILLVIATLIASGALIFAIQNGLLGHPDMMIRGNGSTESILCWYQDRMPDGILPQPVFWSFPLIAYRIIMLAWALWLALSLLKWAVWAWQCMSTEKLWEKINWKLPGRKKEDHEKR